MRFLHPVYCSAVSAGSQSIHVRMRPMIHDVFGLLSRARPLAGRISAPVGLGRNVAGSDPLSLRLRVPATVGRLSALRWITDRSLSVALR